MAKLLQVVGLEKHYPIQRGIWQRRVGTVRAVDGVSFELEQGETLGLVGESGCGKTTLARTIVRLTTPTAGHVLFDGMDVHGLDGQPLRKLHSKMQMIFQDPYSSLDPRMKIAASIGEPLAEHTSASRTERQERIRELMEIVGLDPSFSDRYPHEFSGGQRQRIGIARALALNPNLIVCDEPISALDVSIQAQIVNLLKDIQERFGLSYLFISHDLGMVRHLCDRVAVMYLGKFAEIGPGQDLFGKPRHPYTKALLASLPRPNQERARKVLGDEIPSPAEPPDGCPFHTRCPDVEPQCRNETPALRSVGETHQAACHLI